MVLTLGRVTPIWVESLTMGTLQRKRKRFFLFLLTMRNKKVEVGQGVHQTTKSVSWNIRGVGRLDFLCQVKKLVKKFDPNFFLS